MEQTTFGFTAITSEPQIESNLGELYGYIQQVREGYISQPVTLENLAEAKDTLAKFRKIESQIDSKVKSLKKEILKPYEDYQAKVKAILSDLDAVINELSSGVNAAIDAEKKAKEEEVRKVLGDILTTQDADVATVMASYWRDSYLNKTMSLASINKEFKAACGVARAVLDAIKGNAHEAQLIACFKESWDYAVVMDLKKNLEARDAEFELIKRQREEAAMAKAHEPVPDPYVAPEPVAPVEEPVEEQPVLYCNFRVQGTMKGISEVVAYASSIGVDMKRTSQVFKAN